MYLRFICRYRKFMILGSIIAIITFFSYSHLNNSSVDSNLETRSDEHLSKRLTVLVPFRDRFDELLIFVPQISSFLRNQGIVNFRIFILNQSARYRFNRGSLTNVGYILAKNHSDYIAVHDVDLIPLNKNLSYEYPKYGPYHLASPEYHPIYRYPKYFGGILLISNGHFEEANGFSNRYYGWGLEDDEFFVRIRSLGLPIFRPNNLATNHSNTFLHMHYKNRKRDNSRSKLQQEILSHRDNETGLNDVNYTLLGRHVLTVDGSFECQVFNIELHCDRQKTPWCLRINDH